MKKKYLTALELKSNFHKLIDSIDDDKMLSNFYEMLSKAHEASEGALWNRLTIAEQEELLVIEKKSQDSGNLIPHSVMAEKHKKWL